MIIYFRWINFKHNTQLKMTVHHTIYDNWTKICGFFLRRTLFLCYLNFHVLLMNHINNTCQTRTRALWIEFDDSNLLTTMKQNETKPKKIDIRKEGAKFRLMNFIEWFCVNEHECKFVHYLLLFWQQIGLAKSIFLYSLYSNK